jgi:1,3-beta-glucan synthase
MKFDRIDWSRVFFKTYFEKRSIGHLFVNFNRIFVIHVAVYYFYTAYNSPNVYKVQGKNSPAMTWSAVALGGAVATLIMIVATIFEFSYIPTTWVNSSHLARRLLFLLVTLAITSGPTFYIAIVESNGTGGSLSLILGVVQFFISAIATLLFSIVPSGRMFGDRVRGKSRKYLASQTFTASYPPLDKSKRAGSIALWLLVFICKFVESYFYLTLSFSYPIQVMVGMKIQGCTDRFFGNALHMYQPGCFHFDDHVCRGPRPVLPRHLSVVHHLEYRFLHRPIVFIGPINLDALEGYLCTVTEKDLRETASNKGYGGQVQAKGASLCIVILANC